MGPCDTCATGSGGAHRVYEWSMVWGKWGEGRHRPQGGSPPHCHKCRRWVRVTHGSKGGKHPCGKGCHTCDCHTPRPSHTCADTCVPGKVWPALPSRLLRQQRGERVPKLMNHHPHHRRRCHCYCRCYCLGSVPSPPQPAPLPLGEHPHSTLPLPPHSTRACRRGVSSGGSYHRVWSTSTWLARGEVGM